MSRGLLAASAPRSWRSLRRHVRAPCERQWCESARPPCPYQAARCGRTRCPAPSALSRRCVACPCMATTDQKLTFQEPSEDEPAGYHVYKRQKSPYERYMEEEGIPVFRGIGVRDTRELP